MKRPKLAILVTKFLRMDGTLEIGGIETYVIQLINAIKSSHDPCVFQPGQNDRETIIDGIRVVTRACFNLQQLADHISNRFLEMNDIFVVSTEQLNVKTHWPHTVVIQHGIYWDLPVCLYTENFIANWFADIYKAFDNYRNLKRIAGFNNVVCVDHAYPSWYRTLRGRSDYQKRMHIICNHADEQFHNISALSGGNQTISILFARRFMRFRGTRFFSGVAKKLIEQHPNVTVTFCGAGPDEDFLKTVLPPSEQVYYRLAKHHEMPEVIRAHDIVVVPSLGSEGTSLIALEGMAAGRAVVASSVGGLSELIINGYNGILIKPGDADELLLTLTKLVTDEQFRLALASRAKSVAQHCFTFETWAANWRLVINSLEKK